MGTTNKLLIQRLAGPPGGGKTVFSEILKESLNILFSENGEACCVLGQDAYHFPNSYLGSFIPFECTHFRL